ncbi:MAG: DUF5615 family PIN-like protein [Bacillota bacterium]
MHWILHGKLTAAVGEALRRHEQQVHELQELNLPADAPAAEILKAAQSQQREILTADPDLVKAAFEERAGFGRTMVYLQLEGEDVEQDDAIDRLFDRYKRLSPRRLYTVTGTRVKIRQLPGH